MTRDSSALAALLTLALAAGAPADQAHLADGSQLDGELVTMIMKTSAGAVRQLARGEALAYTYGDSAPEPAPGPAAATWGTRPGGVEVVPAAPVVVPAPGAGPVVTPVAGAPLVVVEDPMAKVVDPSSLVMPGAPGLVIDMRFAQISEAPDLACELRSTDPGEQGEVFAFRDVHRQDRRQWVRLGSITRIEHFKTPLFDDAQELALVRTLLRDEEQTRESILAAVEAQKKWEHRMRYWFAGEVRLPPGTWSIYVDMRGLRRHRVWHGVQFLARDTPVVLNYEWASHGLFGR